ncbi:hypothetical protein B296_00053781 [Ensete ventricosum]|uniref:Uncharacterized protein n=1 Tax=Ensete ventricosum TaxID=4639 RepID=A0A426XDF3_ENSVE|nr:hypothetical protein B296_00053781 [Ensete ventricosum]
MSNGSYKQGSSSRTVLIYRAQLDTVQYVYLISGKTPYRPVRTSPAADQYANHQLPGGTNKIDRRGSIEGEKEKKKKKKRKRRKKKKTRRRKKRIIPPFPAPSSLARCPRPCVVVLARGSPESSSPASNSSPARGERSNDSSQVRLQRQNNAQFVQYGKVVEGDGGLQNFQREGCEKESCSNRIDIQEG